MESSINFNLLQIFQYVAVLLTGLVAGLFYGYTCSVNQGLGNLSDSVYLQSFQSINKVIQNPYFFISFIGALLFLPATTWLSYKANSQTVFYLLFAASIVYFIGVFGVTVFGNVPLNEQLEKFTISTAATEELSSMRRTFEKPWNFFHIIRTIATIISFGLTILSIIKTKN